MHVFQRSFANPRQIARFYAKVAVRALYDEVSLYPKPGLVSFVDSGAHKDMNGQMFFRSLFGLRHYFFHIGLRAALGDKPQQLALLGLQAEQTMYQITNGVNTHRGAIFAVGILCSSLCRLSMQKTSFTLDELHHNIIIFWSEYLKHHHKIHNTHGLLVEARYKVPGAKQMAIEGYPIVFQTYNSFARLQTDKTLFGLLAYQYLLMRIEDINILYRVGPEGLAFARQQMSQEISAETREASIQFAIHQHRLFSEKNLSPGGVADMISMLYFLTYLFKRKVNSSTTLGVAV